LTQLDHELSRLPDKYRVPVVLCELEGRSRKEVARLLGVPEGTLSWRLAQAKKMLARRLSRYGTVSVATLLAEGAASARLPPTLLNSTAKVVLTAGTVPVKVMALTEGVLKAMLLTKLKITVCAAALMMLAGVGATGLTYRATAEQPNRTERPEKQGVAALASRPAADDLEALRLEIEALRKSLQATRGRVETLEDEVRTLKKQGGAPTRQLEPPTERSSRWNLHVPVSPLIGSDEIPLDILPKSPDAKGDPLGDAQEALKKLRMNPDDKKAAEAVERAAKWLKERERPAPDRKP
jgi:hypothetical protein